MVRAAARFLTHLLPPLAARFDHFKDVPAFPRWKSGSPDKLRTMDKALKEPRSVPWPHDVRANCRNGVYASDHLFNNHSSRIRREKSRQTLHRQEARQEWSFSNSAFLHQMNTMPSLEAEAFNPTLTWGPARQVFEKTETLPRIYDEMARADEYEVRMLL